ncbi:MAG: DUF4190 domain-containing protein [Kiritimatiellia bacterium]
MQRYKPYTALILGLLSILLFALGVWIMNKGQDWTHILLLAVPALICSVMSMIRGISIIRGKPEGGTYGFAMAGSIAGGMSLVFWLVMIPMLLIFTLPAREMEPEDPLLEQSCAQMKIWVRHIKSFHREHGRLPVRLEELVDKGYARDHLLYDPRQRRRDAPSYRLMVREMPPETDWAATPLLEGRIPHPKDGTRLIVYANETCGRIGP